MWVGLWVDLRLPQWVLSSIRAFHEIGPVSERSENSADPKFVRLAGRKLIFVKRYSFRLRKEIAE
jgi:hypothetical protein